jgi:hypothetical protein
MDMRRNKQQTRINSAINCSLFSPPPNLCPDCAGDSLKTREREREREKERKREREREDKAASRQ